MHEINGKLDTAEQRICKLKGKFEDIQDAAKIGKKSQKINQRRLKSMADRVKKANII